MFYHLQTQVNTRLYTMHKYSYVAVNETFSVCSLMNRPIFISPSAPHVQRKWIIWIGELEFHQISQCSVWVWCSGGERGSSVLMWISFVTALLSVRVRLRSAGPALVLRSWAAWAPASAPGAQQGSRLRDRPDCWESQRLWCLPGGRGLHSHFDPALA